MNNIEQAVAQHYGDADLLTRILAGLEASNLDLQHLHADDLAPVEEFHIGGRMATVHALSKIKLDADCHVLDIGCGIGGAARYVASQFSCKTMGIDLTPEYIHCARALTKYVKLDDKLDFKVASALDLPYDEQSFDAALTLHVAMNIEDRKALYEETARVLKPGASFCIFDVMKKNDGPLQYPVPWAKTAETSFLKTQEQMKDLLEDAGFKVTLSEDRTNMALNFFRERIAAAENSPSGKPPPLGIHLVMKEQPMEKFKNTLSNIEKGTIAPVLMIAQKG